MKASFGGFGANPQNLRITTILEAKYKDNGLDLTRGTLDGLVKHPNLYDSKRNGDSKFTYHEDKELLDWIKKDIQNPDSIPIEGQLADWADQMAYSVNDIEDIVRAGLLNFYDMQARASDISKKATKKYEDARRAQNSEVELLPEITSEDAIVKIAQDFQKRFAAPKLLQERKVNLKAWTSESIKALNQGCRIVALKNNEPSIRYRYRLQIPAKAHALASVLKATAMVLVFSDPRVTTLEAKGRHIIGCLFRKFRSDTSLLPLDFQELIANGGYGTKERLVADFVAGMTDRYAYLYYQRLFHPGTGSFYEGV